MDADTAIEAYRVDDDHPTLVGVDRQSGQLAKHGALPDACLPDEQSVTVRGNG